MSNYGFDLDETLDKPYIAQLARDLFKAGHSIYIITGGLNDSGDWTMEARISRLKSLDVPYTEIVRCIAPTLPEIGQMKAEKCKEYNIVLYFDDMDEYLAPITVGKVKVL